MNFIQQTIQNIDTRLKAFKEWRINRKKKRLRTKFAKKRDALTPEQVKSMSTAIWDHIERSRLFQRAKTIMIYYPKGNEVDTRILIERWKNEKQFVLPVVVDENIELHAYAGEENMRHGKFGIMEPTTPIFNGEIDLLIVPGLLYDMHRNRVGRGGGYYDRFLIYYHVPKFGVCYDFQLVHHAPTLGNDRKVTRIYTNKRRLG